MPDRTAVYPTHGFGRFCSATQSGGTANTIGQGLDAFPAYYAHMGPVNAAGPDEADLSLPPS